MRSVKHCLWLIAGIAVGVASLEAQDVAMTERAPRFLRSAPAGPLPVDVNRTAVLRRRISLALRDVPLGEALTAIAKASGLRLGYSRTVVPVARKIRLVADDITVAGALSTVLFDTGIDVIFSGNQAALIKRGSGPWGDWVATVSGRVTAKETGQPLVGASVAVVLADTTLRAVSGDSGLFRVTDVPPGEHAVTARFIGYRPLTKKIVVDSVPIRVDFALEVQAVALDELISTATGQQRRRDIGNAITTIRADSVLQSAPIKSLTDLLEHRVPGLTVQHTTGAPGDPSRLRLRGLGSALRSNDPVVIVDGVRVYAAQVAARSGNLTNLAPSLNDQSSSPIAAYEPSPAPSPLDQIDPNIIEKIEVFKGPSAATLYGADAANGVIVITTKRGRPGPTRWSGSVTHGRTTSPGRYPTGYYRWAHNPITGLGNVDGQPDCATLRGHCVEDSLVQFQALNNPALTPLGRGHSTTLSLTAGGGTQALTYSITGSYKDETGLLTLPTYEVERFRTEFNREPPDWMRRPQQYTDWSVTSAVTARLSSAAEVTLNTSLTRSDQQRTSLESQLAPLARTYLDTLNGVFYFTRVVPTGSSDAGTHYFEKLGAEARLLESYYTKRTASTITFTTGLTAQWRPRSWFNASGQAGLNVIPRDDRLLLPAGLRSSTDSGTVAVGTGRSLVSTFNLQGTLRKPLGLGFVFETNLGTNLTTTTTNDLQSSATGLVPGTSSVAGATRIGAAEQGSNTSVYGWYIEPRLAGQRLALSTGIRLDGGSAYGVRLTRTGGGGGGFLKSLLSLPKLNGSWVISEEPWFPGTALLSSLRLRAAYGQAQVQPGPTDRLRLYTGTTEQVTSELILASLGNTVLRPERSTEVEAGFDADLLDTRLSVELTALRKQQVDALMPLQLPPSVNGGGTVLTNIGNIRNTGLELTLGLTPVRLPALTWSAQLHYSRNTNRVTQLGEGVVANKTQGLVEGYPLYSRWARPILGYVDQSGDGVLQPEEIQVGDSLVYMGRLYPAWQSSLFTNVALFGGAVGITAGFNYSAGQTQVDQTLRENWVLVQALVDASVPLGEQAAVWATTRVPDPTDYGLMQEVSTFRFNSLSVNYRVPARVARLFRAQQLAIALQGSNLGLHSTYRGKDPDVSAWTASEGIIDTGQLPQPRLWQMRVNLQF